MYRIIAALLFLPLIIISCSTTTGFLTKPENLVIYPEPPDTTRIRFLTKISNTGEITGVREGFSKFLYGKTKIIEIGRPYGIAVNKGRIFICDNLTKSILIMNFLNKEFELFQPTGFGKLQNPINCFIDDKGWLYVADVERKDIVVFDENLKYQNNFGAGIVSKPSDIFVTEDKIYVADIKGSNVMIFDRNSYQFIKPLVESEENDSAFIHQPTNIYVMNEQIYVSDVGESNVKIFNIDGDLLSTVGSIGIKHGNLVRPKGIAVDKENNIYVVDASFQNVQIFNSAGNILMSFGGPYKGPGDMYLPAKVIIDYDNLDYFKDFVDDKLDLKYVIFVTNQYGPDKVTIYGKVDPK